MVEQKSEGLAAIATESVATESIESQSLLDKIIDGARVAKSDSERIRAKDLIGEFINEILEGTITISKDVALTIEARIAEIDRLISEQLSAVMHAEPFQKLEASWRGLNYLVSESVTSANLKIKVLNCTKKEIAKDVRNASGYDQTALFKKIYGEEYDVYGGLPFSTLIGDFEFGRFPEDVFVLEKIAEVAAAAHAPFIAGASPDMFGLDNFTELTRPGNLSKIFDQVDYARWKSFRNSDNSRYVGLALPRVMARLPFGAETRPVEEFNFEEDVSGKEHNKYLWTNAAYALGARITDAFFKYGWCAAICGAESGGKVLGLPTHTFTTDDGEIALKCPTEIAIGERRDQELSDSGFITLVYAKETNYAAFFAVQSVNKPKKYDSPAANANSIMSSQLQYILAVSRFAHYLKVIMRDKIGGFTSRDEIQRYMTQWIMNYVTEDDNAGFAVKAEKPLRAARVDVVEVPGQPGVYKAIIYAQPHHMLAKMTISLRLVAELPKPRNV